MTIELESIDRVTLIDALHVFTGRLKIYMIDDARYESVAKLLSQLGKHTTANELKPVDKP